MAFIEYDLLHRWCEAKLPVVMLAGLGLKAVDSFWVTVAGPIVLEVDDFEAALALVIPFSTGRAIGPFAERGITGSEHFVDDLRKAITEGIGSHLPSRLRHLRVDHQGRKTRSRGDR